jgi:hypothetical protein
MMVGSWQSSEMDKNLKFPCVMEHTGNSSTWEAEAGGLGEEFKASLDYVTTHCLKTTKKQMKFKINLDLNALWLASSFTRKKAGRVAQVVECLSSKCEAQSSNPSIPP